MMNEQPIGYDMTYMLYNIVTPQGEYLFTEHQYFDSTDIYLMEEAVSDGNGGAVIVFRNYFSDTDNAYIYLQHLDSLGNKLWGSPGRLVAFQPDAQYFWLKELIRDPSSGDYFVLYVDRTEYDFMCQRLDSDGYPLWPENGCVVADSTQNNFASQEYHTCLAPDMEGGVYAVWKGAYPYNNYNTYAQHLDAGGNRLWDDPVYGKVLELNPSSLYPEIISDGEGGCIVYDNSSVKRLDYEGNVLWDEGDIAYGMTFFHQGDQGDFYSTSAYDQWYVYAQRFTVDGELLWPEWEVQLYSSLAYIWFCSYGAFFHDGYLFTSVVNARNPQWLMVQKVDRDGNLMWGEDGIGAAYNLGSYSFDGDRGICTDQAEGMVALFHTGPHRNLYAKRILWDGALGGDGMASLQSVVITVDGSDVYLNWLPRSGADHYNIYISDTPYSFPPEPAAVTSDTFYIDTGALTEGIRYYDVRWETEE